MGKPDAPQLPARVSPISLDVADSPLDLDSLAQQLFAIADRLRDKRTLRARHQDPLMNDAAELLTGLEDAANQVLARDARRRQFARIARSLYENRRKRDEIFGTSELFGEPAWDILLDLYIAEAEGKPVSVSSACIGSASPSTTGLRWLGVLAETGLVAREHDPEDQRRVLVRLTAEGLAAMDRFFSEADCAS